MLKILSSLFLISNIKSILLILCYLDGVECYLSHPPFGHINIGVSSQLYS